MDEGSGLMRYAVLVVGFLNGLLNAHVTFAYPISESGDWECSAYDVHYREWKTPSVYQRLAINRALDVCKKESETPSSCTVAQEQCEQFVNGKSTRPLWRCIALDDRAKKWVSNVYSKRDDAAIAALDYCKANSASSQSCYINLLTCKDLNHI